MQSQAQLSQEAAAEPSAHFPPYLLTLCLSSSHFLFGLCDTWSVFNYLKECHVSLKKFFRPNQILKHFNLNNKSVLYGILMRIVYCKNSLRGVMTQARILMSLYCYLFQIKNFKKLKFSGEHVNVAGRGLEDISGTAEMSENTGPTEWIQKEGRDR